MKVLYQGEMRNGQEKLFNCRYLKSDKPVAGIFVNKTSTIAMETYQQQIKRTTENYRSTEHVSSL